MRGSVLRDCLGDWFQSVVLHNKPPDICVGQYYATALEIGYSFDARFIPKE